MIVVAILFMLLFVWRIYLGFYPLRVSRVARPFQRSLSSAAVVFRHRCNTQERLNETLALAERANVPVGVEIDIYQQQEEVLVGHFGESAQQLPLTKFIESIPQIVPIVVDVKSRKLNQKSLSILAEIVTIRQTSPIIFVSFDPRVLNRIQSEVENSVVCLMSALKWPPENWKYSLFEGVFRSIGLFGGTIRGKIFPVIATHSGSFDNEYAEYLHSMNVGFIAGSVENKDEYLRISSLGGIGVFTDNIEKIVGD